MKQRFCHLRQPKVCRLPSARSAAYPWPALSSALACFSFCGNVLCAIRSLFLARNDQGKLQVQIRLRKPSSLAVRLVGLVSVAHVLAKASNEGRLGYTKERTVGMPLSDEELEITCGSLGFCLDRFRR